MVSGHSGNVFLICLEDAPSVGMETVFLNMGEMMNTKVGFIKL